MDGEFVASNFIDRLGIGLALLSVCGFFFLFVISFFLSFFLFVLVS